MKQPVVSVRWFHDDLFEMLGSVLTDFALTPQAATLFFIVLTGSVHLGDFVWAALGFKNSNF